MPSTTAQTIHFRPSRVHGLPDVDEVRISPDRLELRSAGKWLCFRFLSFALGREIGSGRAPVGELHFSKTNYPDSHFIFYTTPRIAIYMPADGPTDYPDSHFWRIQQILRDGGLRLYEDGPPKPKPFVLEPRPANTVLYVLVILAVAWLYALSGFLPGRAGEVARHFLLHFHNPRRPALGLAFILPAAIATLLGVRHGRSARAMVAIIALTYLLSGISEWALRRVIHPWAPLEQAPFYSPFWSTRHLIALLIPVIAAGLLAVIGRQACLEPIPESERHGDRVP